jgi:mannose-6-phosphate isomerase-like protein (cupin superfamily)
MSERAANPIKETKVEGRTDGQQDRGAFESIVREDNVAYWKNLHVPASDVQPMVNKRGEQISDNVASGAEAYNVVSPQTAGTISIRNGVVKYPPRSRSGIRWHNAEEAYYVLAGSGYVELGGEKHEFEQGDGVFIPLRTRHRVVNESEEPLELLVVATMPFRPCEDLAATSIDYREFMEAKS